MRMSYYTSPQDYIQKALVTRAIWLGNHPSFWENQRFVGMHVLAALFGQYKIKTSVSIIQSCADWRKFIASCHWLHCSNGLNWKIENGKKMTFYEWMDTSRLRSDDNYRFDSQKFQSNSVITVFDARRGKRLILDGMHRSAALTRACEEVPNFVFPQVMVFEASGENLDMLFPCDCFQL